jgi:hypothetical protein
MDIGSKTDKTLLGPEFKTYAWIKRSKKLKHADARVDNEIVEGRIIQYTNREMEQRGFVVNVENPDLLLDYDVLTQEKTDHGSTDPTGTGPTGSYYYNFNQSYVGAYSPYYVWPPMAADYGNVKSSYETGTVIIYVADKARNKLIWQSWAEGSVENIRAFEEELPKDIHKMFQRFPLKAPASLPAGN